MTVAHRPREAADFDEAGVDVPLVARMTETSLAMVERFFRNCHNQSYQRAHAHLDR
jgi:hypothetical protein